MTRLCVPFNHIFKWSNFCEMTNWPQFSCLQYICVCLSVPREREKDGEGERERESMQEGPGEKSITIIINWQMVNSGKQNSNRFWS